MKGQPASAPVTPEGRRRTPHPGFNPLERPLQPCTSRPRPSSPLPYPVTPALRYGVPTRERLPSRDTGPGPQGPGPQGPRPQGPGPQGREQVPGAARLEGRGGGAGRGRGSRVYLSRVPARGRRHRTLWAGRTPRRAVRSRAAASLSHGSLSARRRQRFFLPSLLGPVTSVPGRLGGPSAGRPVPRAAKRPPSGERGSPRASQETPIFLGLR